MLGILVQIDAQDAAGSALPVRLASHDVPELCHLGGEQWEPALSALPDFALDFFGGAFAGQVTAPRTGFAVMTTGLAGFSAVPANRARFADARVRIWVGDFTSAVSADLGPLSLRFDGRLTGEPEIDEAARVARFEAAVQDSWADEPLLALFDGSGAIEGPQDLEGQPKPLALGNIRFARGVLIDNVDNVWMVSDGAVQGIGAAYDRLASLGASSGNHASLASLLAASIPNGSWATCLAEGLVRFGAPPDGRVSFDVAGSNTGTGGYVRRPGAMIRRIADLAGGTVNAASLTALNAARPYNLQLQIAEQTTAREVIARIADSVAAVAGVSLIGELFAQPLGFGTASETLNADGTSALPVLAVEELAKAAPSWKLATEAELTFEVHSADEAAFGYRWQGEYSATRVYRLDDVVSGEDGASWAYINTAPAAGQALPVWPVTSNSHWQNFSQPVDPAAIGLEPGATRNVARGTYDASVTYSRGDEVIFSGSTYRLIVASSTGNAPPDVARWALVAQAGSGPAGADGLPGLTILLSNEAHVVATAQDGSGGTYTDAGGQMRLLRGDTVLSPTFSIAAKTPNTSWISIDSSTGVYTVSDPGVDLATATIRANWAGVNYDRTYTLAKSKQGVTGPRLALAVDKQAFTFTDGAATPGSQTITIEALLNNLSGTATWSTTPSVTLGGSGNTRTLSVANFGSNRQVTVEATLGGITDRVTLVRVDRDAFGGDTNRIRFSRMEGGRGWELDSGTTVPIITAPLAPVQDADGRNRIVADVEATAAGQLLRIAQTSPHWFQVTPGERLHGSARLQSTGLADGPNPDLWQLFIQFYTGAGGYISAVGLANGTTQEGYGARRGNFVTVPANAVYGEMLFWLRAAGPGRFRGGLVDPMVVSATPDQTAAPAYVPGFNAEDGALPNDLITIDGNGLLQGIGTGAGEPVNNKGVVPSGLAANRPASGAFPGQVYFAIDTRVVSRWDGFQWIDGPTRNTGALADLDVVNAGGPEFVGTLPVSKADTGLRNSSIAIDGNGQITGIGTGAGTPVNNAGVVLAGTLAARPASGAYAGQTYVATDTAEFFRWSGSAWVKGSDVTQSAQITTSQPAPFQIQADAAGVTTTDLSTQTRSITLFRGGVAQTSGVTVGSTSATAGITIASATVSGGIVTVTLATANASGSVTIPVIFAGVTYRVTIAVNRALAAPVAGGSGSQPFIDQTWTNITSTTYTQVTDVGATVLSTSGGQLQFSYSAQYEGGVAQCKCQYSLNGATWTDVAGTEVTGSAPITIPGEESPGEITRSAVTQSGLTGSTLYYVRLVARRTTGSGTLSWLSPSFTAKQP